MLVNVELVRGICPHCQGKISKEWAGENPILGSICKTCWDKPVFGIESVDLHGKYRQVVNPFFGTNQYWFDFVGSRVKVNGREGILIYQQADAAEVDFRSEPTQDRKGNVIWIKDLGTWDLKKLYEQTGGKIKPPSVDISIGEIVPIPLLENPIFPVIISKDGNGNACGVQVGKIYEEKACAQEIAHIALMRDIANTTVRAILGLDVNYCHEGGLNGRGFELRNSQDVGLHEYSHKRTGVATLEELEHDTKMQRMLDFSIGNVETYKLLDVEGSIENALVLWQKVMETLLRFDWNSEDVASLHPNEVLIKMFGLLRNHISQKGIDAIFDFAKRQQDNKALSAYEYPAQNIVTQ